MQTSNDVEYEYHVDVVASEAFRNLMSRVGITSSYDKGGFDFSLKNRLDMKSLKDRGIISSYKIVRSSRSKEALEEG
jgi:hypothetical protein